MTHLDALELRLSHERRRLANARSQNERDLRYVWISQIEAEIEDERRFTSVTSEALPEMSDDELLAALGA